MKALIVIIWSLFIAASTLASLVTGNFRVEKYMSWRNGTSLLQYMFFYVAAIVLVLSGKTKTDETAAIGVIVTFAAFIFYIYLLVIFRKNYKPAIDVDEKSHLFDLGPYRWIRHPIYLAHMIMMLGTLMSFGLDRLLLLLPSYICFYLTAKKEEMLMSEHAPGYVEYQRRTKMFLPYLI